MKGMSTSAARELQVPRSNLNGRTLLASVSHLQKRLLLPSIFPLRNNEESKRLL